MPAKFRKDRLLKIAEHLEAGKLGHKKFDFRYFNNGAKDARGCGTSGCAVGSSRSFSLNTGSLDANTGQLPGRRRVRV